MWPVAVLAGGLGTRVRHLTGESLPKAMLPIAGRPFVDHKLDDLRRAGAERVVMLVGHGAQHLRAHVGDGARFGLAVEYVDDGPDLAGTAGALRRALPALGSAFFVTYGDTLLDVALDELQRLLLGRDALGVMTVLENADHWETSNVDVRDGLVTAYERPATPGTHRFIDYGMLALRADALAGVPADVRFDLAPVLRSLVARRALLASPVRRRFYDVGTEAALQETERFLLSRRA